MLTETGEPVAGTADGRRTYQDRVRASLIKASEAVRAVETVIEAARAGGWTVADGLIGTVPALRAAVNATMIHADAPWSDPTIKIGDVVTVKASACAAFAGLIAADGACEVVRLSVIEGQRDRALIRDAEGLTAVVLVSQLVRV